MMQNLRQYDTITSERKMTARANAVFLLRGRPFHRKKRTFCPKGVRMQREHFASRLGFILVSAGCAVGIGNVWKFPYLAGQYGGAAFILIYLVFLVILGLPIMVCEFSVGRSSQKSVARSFDKLEPAGTRWHNLKFIGLVDRKSVV